MGLTHHAHIRAVHEQWQTINDRYAKLYYKVFVEDTTHIPTAEQASILNMVHLLNKSEYFILNELLLTQDIACMSPKNLNINWPMDFRW